MSYLINDLTIGWTNFNFLSHPNATLVLRARQARANCENLNYVHDTSASGEILNYLLSHYSDIL